MHSKSAPTWLELAWLDVRHSMRRLRKEPLFLVVSVLSLELQSARVTSVSIVDSGYSWRRATTGSSRIARRAGTSDTPTPTRITRFAMRPVDRSVTRAMLAANTPQLP